MSELIRVLTPEEKALMYGYTCVCCWTSKNEPNCARLPVFRLATPHGHMDFCDEHIGYMIAALPAEWLDGFAYREPLAVEAGDDIPF